MENDTIQVTADESCLEKHHFSELKEVTNFSINDMLIYCARYDAFSTYDEFIDHAIGYSMAITGLIGLFNCVFTLITFSDHSAFIGPSFMYHRVMALIEMVHMAVMCQYGVLRVLKFPGGTYSMVAWRDCFWGGWMFGDTAKLCINCLTTFVSVERVIAVWFPLHFELINRYSITACAIVISCMISSLQLSSLGAYYVKLTVVGGYFTGEQTEFGLSGVYEGIQDAIYFMKLGLGAATFVLCVLIALGMYRSNKRVSEMSTDVQSRWHVVKMGCYLQLIVAVSGLIDHVAWVAFKIVDHPYPMVGRNAIALLDSLDVAKHDLARMRVRLAFEVVQVLAGEIDHGGRFYFYLIFHSTFRQCFKNVWKRVTEMKGGAVGPADTNGHKLKGSSVGQNGGTKTTVVAVHHG